MKKNQKGFANVILIGVLVILIGSLFYYLYRKNYTPDYRSCDPGPCETTPKDETKNWKTYTEYIYGFEFRYPASYHMNQLTTKYDLPKGLTYLLNLVDYDTKASIKVFIESSFNLENIKNKYAPTGNENVPAKKIFGQNAFY